MKIRLSISAKLLLFILPLVFVPVATVGYFSIRASVERVNRLVRHEQMVEVKTTANRINDVFYYCRTDLETISRLPVFEDYLLARSFRLEAESDFNRENIIRLSQDFIRRTPYYHQIRYLDEQGSELIKVRREGVLGDFGEAQNKGFFSKARQVGMDGIYISDILSIPDHKGLLIQFAKPFFTGLKEFSGLIVIDLDYDRLMETVKSIRVGEKGYAFMIDQEGRNIAHPFFEPYTHGPDNYPDESLNDLVLEMRSGGIGWKNYFMDGENKVAAFAPVPIMGWSLAVTIPSDEYGREAQAIRSRVIQVVAITLILAALGISILSYNLLRPVRKLVAATNRIAGGDLRQEIPMRSRDELGELILSFNRMVRNLSRVQKELVHSEKLISLGRLSAGVAHEIRNPLNAMKGAIVYLQRKRPEDPLIGEYTRLISEEIDRLNRFVTEFLYFAKQSMPKKTSTDLNRLILSTQALFQEEAQERGIRFENQLDSALPLTKIDPDQIEQVLVNLMTNGMDAMPKGGALIFSSYWGSEDGGVGSFVRLKVRDKGEGISPEHLNNIFDPFFSTKESGTGLGLPLSLGIIENHGGKIRVSSQEGLGTTVTIELPFESQTGG
jgi:two-component system, NtrC family, sensor kinase